ncbi:MAG: ABC transporter substrate-binding protein [Actinobacteria bacterium]|nr:ABC transporter substrate-binding protein [Actinomycetota bacterium]
MGESTRRRIWSRLVAGVVLALVLAIALVPVAAADEASPPPGDADKVVFKVGWMGDIDNLNPLIGWSNNVYEIYSQEYLLMVGRDWDTYKPDDSGIAKSWEVSDDGLVWTFRMHEGMTWHDGEPVTAEDAVFTYNFIIDNEIAAYASFVVGIDRAEVVDDLTYRVVCTTPVASMLMLWIPCLPEHIWSKMTAKEASQTFQNPAPCIGNGPYQVVEWKKERFLRMEAYEDFYLGKPTIDELVFVVYQNGDTMVQDLKSGAIDAAYSFPPAQFDSLAATEGIEAIEFSWFNWDYIGFNCYEGKSKGHPVLRDKDFRIALEYAIDREKLVDLAYGGHAWPGYTFMPPNNWSDPDYAWAPAEGEARDFDPDQSRALLDAAGYRDTDGDGIREYKGKPITIRLWAQAEIPDLQRAGKLIAGWWEDVGVDVALSVHDEGVYFDNIWAYEGDTYVPDFDAYLWGWDGYADPGQSLTCFTSRQIEGWNEFGWSNEDFDRLDTLQSAEMDQYKRAEYIKQMQAVMYEDCPQITTVFPLKLEAYRTDKWSGWQRSNNGNGGTFLIASMPWPYSELTPKVAEQASTAASSAWIWVVVVVVAVVAVAVIVVLVRHRSGPSMEE